MNPKHLLVPFLAIGMLWSCLSGIVEGAEQKSKPIPPGSKVYINPIEGFETWLVAGFHKKKVPLTVVSEKEQADFEITGTIQVQEPSKWEKLAGIGAAVMGDGNVNTKVDVAISVKDLKAGEIVFAYAWGGKRKAQQSAAEACAKNLKKKIEGK